MSKSLTAFRSSCEASARSLRLVSPGLVACGVIAITAALARDASAVVGLRVSAPLLALVLGMLLANLPKGAQALKRAGADQGLAIAKRAPLRAGVVALGMTISLQELAGAGPGVLILDLLMVSSTLSLGVAAGRVLKMDPSSVALVSAGCGICGASAVMATQQALSAPEDQTTAALATVSVFGTIALIAYPVGMPSLAGLLAQPGALGAFVGGTVHEVAQVLALGQWLTEPGAANLAVVSKLGRVLLLGPALLALHYHRQHSTQGQAPEVRDAGAALRATPLFPLLFVLATVAGSTVGLAEEHRAAVGRLSAALISVSLAGVGIGTRWQAVRTAGLRPLLLGGVLTTWLVVAGSVATTLIFG